LLHPALTPSPLVNVEVTVARADAAAGPWRIAIGTADRIARPFARDASGDIEVAVAAATPGVELRLARAPVGPVTLAYAVLAKGDPPDDPTGVSVLEDRFRGAGERLVALPAGIEDTRGPVLVRIDGEALRASAAASSLGIGATRRAVLTPRALRYATFVAGSLGVQMIDDPGAGHDEGAWLGYTSFDPRPTIAELAQVRTSLRELLKSQDEPGAWTYLVVSQTRPMGWFRTTPRVGSVLLQVGPAEPWTAWLRLSVAQQLARRWIGGELRVQTDAGHEAEGLWFAEGVSRYVAMLALSRLGLLTPDDVRAAVAGELAVIATSPDRTMPNARLSELARSDEVARATCFRAGMGEYVAFDPGFDLDATRASPDGKVSGVRPDGPAAKAGLQDGDVVESMQAREADGETPVKLVVTRDGARVTLSYVPRGARGRGQAWTRVPGVPDGKCGQVP
jgi:hypothetical protein